jgi:hypothetical protein
MSARHQPFPGEARAVLVAALLSLSVPPARANIGERWWGRHASEPLGGLRAVEVVRERLRIDLRPLARAEPAGVEATYRLRNRGPAQRLDLVFIAGGDEVDDFEVRLGGRTLPCRQLPASEVAARWWELPEVWKPPTRMPGFERDEAFANRSEPGEGLTMVSFAVEVPAGLSELRASYRVRPAGADERRPTATWQLPYVLAPARDWGGFGGLEVEVLVPEGWECVSSPGLRRDGDFLHGQFDSLPADALLVSTRAPVGPNFYRSIYLAVGLYVVAVLGGGALCWAAGCLLGYAARGSRNRFRTVVCLGLAGFAGLAWAALMLLVERLCWSLVRGALGGQEAPYFHEQGDQSICCTLLLALLLVPAGGVLAYRSAHGRFRGTSEGVGHGMV